MEYFVHFPGADKGFRDNPFKEWAKNGDIDDLPGLSGFTPVKQAPVTQKMLESEIAELEKQISTAQTDVEKALLVEKKAQQQALLEKKAAKAMHDKLVNQNKKIQAKLESYPIKTYSGIWQQDVSIADWADKAASIQSKKDYFLSKLAKGGLSAEDVGKFQQYLKDLDEFSAKGQEYYNLQKTLKNNQESLLALKKVVKLPPIRLPSL